MYHPTTRVLTVLELLQSRGTIGSRELAERLEVSPRSVRRYVTMLQDLGIPVESRPGRHGGYQLRPGFKLPPLMLTNDEALTVTLGLQMISRLGLASTHPSAIGALAKIDRILPENVRTEVRAVEDTLVFDDPPPAHSTATDLVVTISTAVQARQRIWIRYASPKGDTARTIDPYGIIFRDGTWYLVGWCHLRSDTRIFRLDRILRYRRLAIQFQQPSPADTRASVLETLERRFGGAEVQVMLKTTIDEARHWVPAVMGTLQETNEGVLMTCNTGSIEWMAAFLACTRCPIEIHRPAELMAELERMSQRIARIEYHPQYVKEEAEASHHSGS